jgi:hypothetical protein
MFRNATEILLNKAMDHIGETLEQPTNPQAWGHLLVYCPREILEQALASKTSAPESNGDRT